MEAIHVHEQKLTAYALEKLKEIDGLTILGPLTAKNRGGAISFKLDGVHPHDMGQVLDDSGICIRVGHHCAWPIHRSACMQSTGRASFYLYNTFDEVDQLVAGLHRVKEFFGV